MTPSVTGDSQSAAGRGPVGLKLPEKDPVEHVRVRQHSTLHFCGVLRSLKKSQKFQIQICRP